MRGVRAKVVSKAKWRTNRSGGQREIVGKEKLWRKRNCGQSEIVGKEKLRAKRRGGQDGVLGNRVSGNGDQRSGTSVRGIRTQGTGVKVPGLVSNWKQGLQITPDCKTCHWTRKQTGRYMAGSRIKPRLVKFRARFVRRMGGMEIPETTQEHTVLTSKIWRELSYIKNSTSYLHYARKEYAIL